MEFRAETLQREFLLSSTGWLTGNIIDAVQTPLGQAFLALARESVVHGATLCYDIEPGELVQIRSTIVVHSG